jgi:hypothetical protein
MKQTKQTNTYVHALSWKPSIPTINGLWSDVNLHSHQDWLLLPLPHIFYLKTVFIQLS